MMKSYKQLKLACYVMLIFTLSIFQGKAQDAAEAKKNIAFGVKAGANISSLTSDYVNLPDLKVGYQAGLFTMFKVSSALSVEIDVLYGRFGSNCLNPEKIYTTGSVGTNDIVKSGVVMNALEVPLLANIYVFGFGSTKVRLMVGPEVNFYLTSSAIDTRMDATGETKSATIVSGSFQTYDVAGVAGIGLDFPAGNHTLGLELRYRAGITPVNIIRSSSFKDFGLNALSLNIGYTF
jgi:hypothetical protein